LEHLWTINSDFKCKLNAADVEQGGVVAHKRKDKGNEMGTVLENIEGN
jgi:hypothetical protein